MLKTIKFPSVSFPSADLRVNNGTAYDFHCTSCGNAMSVDFGWIVRGQEHHQSNVNAHLAEAARQHLHIGPFGHLELAKCPSCEAAYLIHARIDETSNNAFRVIILGAAEVI